MKQLFCLLLIILIGNSTLLRAQSNKNYLERNLPSNWIETEKYEDGRTVNNLWWKLFEDSLLTATVNRAMEQNKDIGIAIDRILAAKANYRMAQGQYYPTINIGGGWIKQETSANNTPMPQQHNQFATASLNMSWQVDIFGSIRNRVRAQKENFAATKSEYDATLVSLCAEVASAYIQLRTAQQEKQVALQNIISQKEVLKITEAQFSAGLVSKLDVAQAKSVYYSTQAVIPQYDTSIDQAINQIALLLGMYPSDIRNEYEVIAPLPQYIEIVRIGVPANLMMRRPDIQQAEHNIAAQASLLGASRADWFPTFLLNGSIGYASQDKKNFFNRSSMTYQIAPSINWTIFAGGERVQATRSAKAQLDLSIKQFNQAVLNAVQEVESAMSDYSNAIKQIEILKEVVKQGEETFSLSLKLYKQGLTPFQNVLDAQRSLLSFQNGLVKGKGYAQLSLISLYQSLGGGWSGK